MDKVYSVPNLGKVRPTGPVMSVRTPRLCFSPSFLFLPFKLQHPNIVCLLIWVEMKLYIFWVFFYFRLFKRSLLLLWMKMTRVELSFWFFKLRSYKWILLLLWMKMSRVELYFEFFKLRSFKKKKKRVLIKILRLTCLYRIYKHK